MKSSRGVLGAALCAAVALAGAVLTGMAAESGAMRYRGLVFEDRNANGIRDPDEAGVGGTMVSDGRHVVKTDRDGRFDLPGFEKTRFIQITVPAGYGFKSLAADIADKMIANAIRHGISERYDFISGQKLGVEYLGMTCTVVTMMLDGLSRKHQLKVGSPS